MPEPALYVQAMTAAALASAFCVLVMGRLFLHRARPTAANIVSVVAMTAGLLTGYLVLQRQFAWPPGSALDRLLQIVLPIAIVIELLAAFDRVPRSAVWILRVGLAGAVPRIVLHNSVYLSRLEQGWTTIQTGRILLMCAGILATEWYLLVLVARRRERVSVPIAIAAAMQCAGITVLLAGYVTGGAAALPFVAALVGVVLSCRLTHWTGALEGVLGVTLVGLFGLLLIGRFFSVVSTDRALMIFCAPLLCWVTELPVLRTRPAWLTGIIRLLLVMIPLTIVLILAKQDFNRDTLPLL